MQIKCGYYVQKNTLRLRVSCQGSRPSPPVRSCTLGLAGGLESKCSLRLREQLGALESLVCGGRGPGVRLASCTRPSTQHEKRGLLSLCPRGPPPLLQPAPCSSPTHCRLPDPHCPRSSDSQSPRRSLWVRKCWPRPPNHSHASQEGALPTAQQFLGCSDRPHPPSFRPGDGDSPAGPGHSYCSSPHSAHIFQASLC